MPFKPGEREYRSFKASNFRALEGEDDKPSYRVRGHYTTFNQEYQLYERTKYWPAEYEQIDSHALDDADLSDVIFQLNHDGAPLARQRNNSLTLGTDETGAWCEAYLGGCQAGRDLFESIQNGLIVEMSFGFTLPSDDEEDRGFTTFADEAGDYHTTITRIKKVFDVSAVSIPANPNTEIGEMRKRSYLFPVIEGERKAREAEEAAEQERAAKEAAELSRARRARRARALKLINL